MKFKLLLIITIFIIAASCTVGLYNKSSYLDYNNEERPFENFMIGAMNEVLLDVLLERYDNELENDNYIIAVKCEEKSLFRHSCTTQKVTVEHIFKGTDLNVGDTIEIAKSDSEIFTSDDMKINGKACINMGFVNEMQPGKTYLVFLNKKLNTHSSKTIIYLTNNYIMAPIFCYENIPCSPCTTISETDNSVFYGDVKEYEFFLTSQKAIDKLEQYKENLITKYSYK